MIEIVRFVSSGRDPRSALIQAHKPFQYIDNCCWKGNSVSYADIVVVDIGPELRPENRSKFRSIVGSRLDYFKRTMCRSLTTSMIHIIVARS